MSASYAQRPRTTPSRHAERAAYDEATVHDVLDSAVIGHLAYVADERPYLLPMLFVRVGRTVFLHASTGAHPARLTARRGQLAAVFEATIVDGLVLARSAFSHSANYRSVVAHGDLTLVTEPGQKDTVLRALLDKLVPGRVDDARPPEESELRQTAVLALELDEVGAKVRAGGPLDQEQDLERPCWAGVLPIERRFGRPESDGDLGGEVAVPDYLAALVGTRTYA
jgi:hypothetical protein